MLDDLKMLNSQIIDDSDKMRIVYTRQSKQSKKWTVHVATTGQTYVKLVNTKLDMGWNYCYVHEDLKILKCFKCGMFGHKSLDCTSEKKCTYCTGPHDRAQCQKLEKKCINCLQIKEKYNEAHKYDHDGEDEDKCPVYAKKCRLARERINYDATQV